MWEQAQHPGNNVLLDRRMSSRERHNTTFHMGYPSTCMCLDNRLFRKSILSRSSDPHRKMPRQDSWLVAL